MPVHTYVHKLVNDSGELISNISIGASIDGFIGCCGMRIISNFAANIKQERIGDKYESSFAFEHRIMETRKIVSNPKVREKIYSDWLKYILTDQLRSSSLIVTTDYVDKVYKVNRRMLSLFDMGTVLKWDFGPETVNPNTGNKIVHMSYITHSPYPKV